MRKLLVASALIAAPLLAQVSTRVDVKVINVDVSVIDAAGKPVTDLNPADFEVLEDDTPQTMTNFALVSRAPIHAAASSGKSAASVSGFLGLSVLANSAHPDLAVAWLRYLTSPEVQAQQTAELPIWTSLQNSADLRKVNPQIGVFLSNLANARPRPKLGHYVEASSVLQRHLHDLVLGNASPTTAMAQAQAELLALQARFAG